MRVIDLIHTKEADFRTLSCNPRYLGLIPQKLRFLALAALRGCKATGEVYLVDGEETGGSAGAIMDLLNRTQETWFEYRTGNASCLLNRAQMQKQLMQLKKGEAVILKSLSPAKVCGQAWYTVGGRVFIEAYKGGFTGLISAMEMPSWFVTDGAGRIESKQERACFKYYAFDEAGGGWQLQTCAGENVTLSDRQREEICALLHAVNPDRLRMKIIWGISREKLAIQDLYLPLGLGILE